MKRFPLKLVTKIVVTSMFVPQIVFGSDVFKPNIRNQGQYIPNLAQNKNVHRLYGHVPADVKQSTRMQAMEKDKVLKLSIVLPLNNENRLNEKLISITNPQSPEYQNFLSQAEFIDQYSPTIEQVNKTNDYLEKNGMNIESVAPNRLIIRASGSVDDIEKIFHTTIYYYSDSSGKTFYAPAYELQVNKDLNILSVQGLENRIKAHPNYKILKQVNTSESLASSAGPSEGLTPASIKKAYSLTSNLNGSGQTLALFELDGYTGTDVTAYEDAFNLPHVPLQNILIDGASGIPSSGGGPAEVELDIELMTAMAPGASQILVYEGPNSGTGLVDTYNRIATDNLAKSISTSWALTESSGAGSIIQAESAFFKQMVAQGQALYAAAGDAGAYSNGQTLSVEDPSSQQFVVAVGGTKLFTNTDGSYKSETTWASGSGPGGEGGGGGISTIWSIPSWQQGVISTASLGSTTMRNIPDISLDADPSSGYAVLYKGGWTVFGGTSCAAPLWAAFTALVNQSRVSNGLSTLGFPNPTIYALGQSVNYPSTFHDIADGSTNLHYPAVQGYDLATGWGTFIADPLIASLAGGVNPPPPPVCTPANPTVSISPTSQQSTAGGALSYTVIVTDNDSKACGTSSFNLAATVPSGFSDTLSLSSLNVSPGTSGTASIQVTSETSTASGNYSFSVNAVNSGSSSYSATGSATYIINPSQNQLSLTISPQNATFTYNSRKYATFQFTLKNGQNVIPNNPVTVTVKAPNSESWSTTLKTQSNGVAPYNLYLDTSLPVGNYQITATAQYNGNSISGQTGFVVQQ